LLLSTSLAGCTSGPIAADPSADGPPRKALALPEPASPTEMGVSVPAVPNTIEPDAALASTPFVSITALCATQMATVVPRLRQAERDLDGMLGGQKLKASCDENRAAMKGVKLSMRAPFYDASAITFEDGWGTETDLVVRTADGWVRVAGALAYEGHADPGCPSIVRGRGAAEVRVEQIGGAPALVVVSEADRGWEDADSYGSMVFSQIRSCRLGGGKISCQPSATIGARLEMIHRDTQRRLPEKEIFKTTYTIDDEGVVHRAKSYELEPS
jgi:hypothetical protein